MNTAGRKAVQNINNADGNVWLLTCTHSSISTQRLAMAKSNVSSTVEGGGAQTFTAYPFALTLPTDDKGVPRGSMQISNVTKLIWDLIGALESPPQINLYRVLESDLNTAQDSFLLLDVRKIVAQLLTVEAEFGHENYAVEPYPCARVIARFCPWMIYTG